ncbi:MAG: ABC transporter ATP-binding protein [Candidatus Puniceispirillaceae bacterium]
MNASFLAPFSDTARPELAITAYGLEKTYRGQPAAAPKQALKSVDIEVPRGCIFGLLGPNGAGKSTFINILAGTVIKTAGKVSVWGSDLDSHPRQLRANIGIVPQELNIDVYFTPRELLEFTAGMYGVPRAERRTDALLALMGLSDKAGAYARTLSGGMRRRLLVAKAMVHQPPVLVLDEPTAGVDVELRQRLWDTVQELNDNGVTIVLTTHYLEEAERLCDHIAILNKGEIITSQPKQQLLKSAAQKDLILSLPEGLPKKLSKDFPKTLPAEIAALNPVIEDGQMRIRFNPNHTHAGAILARLNAAGIRVGDVSTDEPDLEDIFLTLTREASQKP